MFYLAGFFITFFLFIVLISKKGKSQADKILALWLFFTGLHLILFYLFITQDYKQFPYLLGVEKGLPLIHGPFLYLYTRSLTSIKKLTKASILHFAPVVALYIVMIPFFLLPTEKKIDVYVHEGAGYEWIISILLPSIVISGVVYVVLSFYLLRRHKANIENQFSDTEKINLNWLRYLIYGTSVIWIIVISGMGDDFIYSAVVVYVFFIGYFGIKQVGIFSNISLQQPIATYIQKEEQENILIVETIEESVVEENAKITIESTESVAKVKYKKSSLSQKDAENIHARLLQLMNEEQFYKNPELTLGDLAEKLSVHPNTLSQVINSFEQKNFYDYINTLRIEAFKNLIEQPESKKFTLLSLAFECGFNSKTAFNRNFKKVTGLSPTEYLEQSKIELSS